MMLDVKDLRITFRGARGREVVHGISFQMDSGERLGIVGESGAGKTVTALSIPRLLDRQKAEVTGSIVFKGQELVGISAAEIRKIQGRDIGFIFQEPILSLNPLMHIDQQIEESLLLHTHMTKQERHDRMIQSIRDVGLPEPEITARKYPHQLSGGQCQRVMIASALVCHPSLLIADEPTTALDVTVQSQILALLRRKNEEENVGILYISHDLALVRRLCSRVIVMYNGEIVEQGSSERIFTNPREDYTKRLIAAIPKREKRYDR